MNLKKKLHVETAGLGGMLGPAGGALEEGATREKPIEGAIGGGLGTAAGGALGAAAGTAAGALTGPFAPVVAPIAGGVGGMAGGAMGAGVGGDVLGGRKKQDLLKAATSDLGEGPDAVEAFLNKHSSTPEAVQEFGKKKVLPPVEGNGGTLVTSTACNTGRV